MDFMAGSIKLWEVCDGARIARDQLGARSNLLKRLQFGLCLQFRRLVTLFVSAGTLKQWDTRTGRQLRGADLNHGKNFAAAYFSADARLLATMSQTRSSLAVWDVGSGRKLQELKLDIDNGERLLAFAISPDGRMLATNIESNKGARQIGHFDVARCDQRTCYSDDQNLGAEEGCRRCLIHRRSAPSGSLLTVARWPSLFQ